MRRLARIATVVVLWGGLHWAQEPSLSGWNPTFESANIVSATDVRYPLQSIAIGTVILEVAVSETGNVENVQPLRAIPSLTEVAIESVKHWHFKPALLGGKPVRSRTAIAVTFNPAALPASNVPLPPLSAKGHPHSSALQLQPVEVIAAAFPQYPASSVTTGTVVLRVTVDENGRAEKTMAVRRIASLTSQCIRTVSDWKFKPAEFQGKPSRSSIALAFVLRPPLRTN